MNWKTKALVQQFLSQIPGGNRVYYWGQRLVGGLRHYTIEAKVQQAINMINAFEQTGETVSGKVTLELGTGWKPVVPILFWLLGQERCYTLDVSRHLTRTMIIKTAEQLLNYVEKSSPPLLGLCHDRVQFLRDSLQENGSIEAFLAQFDIRYSAPVDTADTRLPDASLDVVFSNTVLEHVPVAKIPSLFLEARRILKPGAHMLHQIDLSDHFAHRDRSIPVLNFLQYSATAFARYNSRIFYQNRLRAPDYAHLVQQYGFDIIHWEIDQNIKALSELPFMRLDDAYSKFTPEELSITGIRLIARRQQDGRFSKNDNFSDSANNGTK